MPDLQECSRSGGNLGGKTALTGAIRCSRPLIPADVSPAQRSLIEPVNSLFE
jgi:hypothetical protein